MKVRITNTALEQLDTILTELGAINPTAKAGLVKRFHAALRLLEDFPHVAQNVEQRPEMCRLSLIHYPYIVYYQVLDDEVAILQIVHGARRQPWETP